MTAPLELSGAKQPQVISASLGLCEPDVIGSLTESGLNDVEAALAAASASGITFLASSGDDGSRGLPGRQRQPGPSPRRQLPGVVVVGHRGRRHELHAQRLEPDHRPGGLERQRRPAGIGGWRRSERAASAGPRTRTAPTKSKGRVVPDVSMLADIAPGLLDLLHRRSTRLRPDRDWIRRSAARARRRRLLAGGFALVDEALRAARAPGPRPRQPAAVQARASSRCADHGVRRRDRRRQRRRPCRRGYTAARSGCCAAGAGFDDGVRIGQRQCRRRSPAGGGARRAADRARSPCRCPGARPDPRAGDRGHGVLLSCMSGRRVRDWCTSAAASPFQRLARCSRARRRASTVVTIPLSKADCQAEAGARRTPTVA